MAYKIIDGKYNEFAATSSELVASYVLDSASDLSSLPKSAPGSTAVVAAKGGSAYMVNASGAWEEL